MSNYDTDFYAWAQQQAQALRAKDGAPWTSSTWRRRWKICARRNAGACVASYV